MLALGNKCDIATEEQIEHFKAYIEKQGLTFLPISAATNQGLKSLPGMVWDRLQQLPPVQVFEPDFVPYAVNPNERKYTIEKTGDHEFTIDAPWLERILAGSDVDDYESLQYFQRQLDESGILRHLVEQGVEEEDTIKIGDYEFDYIF